MYEARAAQVATSSTASWTGGWILSTDLWRQCMVLENHWLRAMSPYACTKGRPWHERGPAASHTARTKSHAWGLASLWEGVCRQVRSWAGLLARALAENPWCCSRPWMAGKPLPGKERLVGEGLLDPGWRQGVPVTWHKVNPHRRLRNLGERRSELGGATMCHDSPASGKPLAFDMWPPAARPCRTRGEDGQLCVRQPFPRFGG